MAKGQEKTNVMRLLDSKKISYISHTYATDITEGVKIAAILGEPQELVYKTLVTEAASREHYVFVIPVAATLDLKAAAKTVGEKSVAMLKQKDLLGLTGYIHGGCSPVGMKKPFRTVFDSSAEPLERFYVSTGRVGFQIETDPRELAHMIGAEFAPVCMAED